MVEHMFDTKGTEEFTGDSVLQIRLAVAGLAAEDREHWTGSAKSSRLVELLEVSERLRAEVVRLVKTACLVRDHEPIAGALADGDITVPHVEAVSRVMSSGRERLLPEHVDTLVDQARSLDIGDFGWLMRRWATIADDELGRDTFADEWPRRHLHTSTTLDGWVAGDFLLDPVASATLVSVLDHLGPPDPEDSPAGRKPTESERGHRQRHPPRRP